MYYTQKSLLSQKCYKLQIPKAKTELFKKNLHLHTHNSGPKAMEYTSVFDTMSIGPPAQDQ
jgi:hypothetical protein